MYYQVNLEGFSYVRDSKEFVLLYCRSCGDRKEIQICEHVQDML